MALFPKRIVKKIPKLYEERSKRRRFLERLRILKGSPSLGERVKELIEKADKDALKELKYEVVIDRTIEELRKFLSGAKEEEIKRLLKGILDVDTNKEVIRYFKKLRIPLRKIEYILYIIIKSNNEALDTLNELIKLIESYERTHKIKKRNYIFKSFQSICRNRYSERESLKKFLGKIKESIDIMLRIIETGIESVKKFDYETVLRDLEAEKNRLYGIVKNELAVYGVEIDLFRDDVGLEQLDSYLKRYAKDKSFLGKKTTLPKRRYYLGRVKKIILISAAAYQLATPVVSGFLGSYNVPFATKADMFTEIRQRMEYETIHFQSRNGAPLVGWFFNNPSTDKTIVMCHGINTNKSSYLQLVQGLNEKYNVFIFDFAGYGETEYKMFHSYGFYETDDLYGALDYLAKRGIKEVALFGGSMGGAVCINVAADRDNIGVEIKIVITQNTFSDLNRVSAEIAKKLLILKPGQWIGKRVMELLGRYRIKNIQPVKKIKKVKCFVMIVQCRDDFIVRKEHADYLFRNAPSGNRKKILIWGDHLKCDYNEIIREVMPVLEEHL